MPISVQLPGYRPAQAAGLSDILTAVNGMRTGAAQRDVLNEQAEGAKLSNQQAKIQAYQGQQQMQLLNPAASQETVQDDQGNQQPNPQFNPRAKAFDSALHAGLASEIGAAKSSGIVPDGPNGSPLNDILTAGKDLHGIDLVNFRARPEVSSLLDLTKAKFSGGAAMVRAGAQADNDAKGIANQYHDQMKDYKNVSNSVRKIESILKAKDAQGNPLITKQAIGEANLAVNSIFSPQHQSDSTVDATEYASLPGEFMGALQKLSADPKDANSRKLVEHIVDQAHRIGNVTNQNALQQLDNLDAGNKSLTLPGAQSTAKSTSSQYRKMFSQKYAERGEGITPGSDGNADHAIGATHSYKGTTYTFQGGDWNNKSNWKPTTKTAGE